jgi:hypothetical protein
MLKYLTKIAMDILPSVVATVIGAYIVNHYIAYRPAADAPAVAVSTADPKKAADTASVPEPGIKAKGISEKGMMEKTASERPAEVKPTETKLTETKPIEIANAPAEPRRHPLLPQFLQPREKPVAKAVPAPAPSPPAVANAPATPAPAASPAPSVEAAVAPTEEHRDAAELARAAIDRLRGITDKTTDKSQEKSQDKTQEAMRAPEAPKVQEPPRTVAVAPTLRPLPPPITVATPSDQGTSVPAYPPYTASVRNDDPDRPTPPADIPPPPAQPPLDLRADAATAPSARDHAHNMAEDMLSAARSVFHAVLPTPSSSSTSSSSKFTD